MAEQERLGARLALSGAYDSAERLEQLAALVVRRTAYRGK
jgi:hypothetical protein